MLIDVVMQVEGGARWLRFDTPIRVLEARAPGEIGDLLREVERATRGDGHHAAGFLTYEAGTAFGLATHAPADGLPLAWFGIFDARHVQDIPPPPRSGAFEVGELALSIAWPEFKAACDRIHAYLASGDTYQVNFTARMQASFAGDPAGLFAELVAAQQGQYSALFRIGSLSICSASPELFIARTGSTLVARPMKGTTARGRSVGEDEGRASTLQTSEKERAENVMVVDMMRNDLGRIAETGSVSVRNLFGVERYPTLWQMTTEVVARTQAPLPEIFAAAFPAASITGAPKVRTMEIIKELEPEPRGVYTGTIGYVAPGGDAQFNVAIRTAVIDHDSGRLSFGVGSGIVWDSDARREYEECLLKAEVLRRRMPVFELLETLRWTPGVGYFLRERHLERMQASARYFGMECRLQDLDAALDKVIAGAASTQRVRLLLGSGGTARTESAPLELSSAPAAIGLAAAPIDPSDPFLFHKTTNRRQHEEAQRSAQGEAILWNPRRQVTESLTSNIVIERDGARVTPPVECGLLAGTFRAELLAQGLIQESIVTIEELLAAPRIWLINSVREWRVATLGLR